MKYFVIVLLVCFFIVALFLVANTLIVNNVPINSKFGKWWNKHVTSYKDMDLTDDEKERR